MEKEKNRIEYCDLLRFIAIISVVLIHVLADFRDYYLIYNKSYYLILTFIDSITRAGVPIFFMLTGIFMLNSKKDENYKDFLKKRIPKLIIPFFIISIIYYIYETLKSNKTLSIINFINLFTSDNIKYHFWFMYSIILIYLLIPFLKKLIQSLKKEELRNLITIIFISNILTLVKAISQKYDLNLLNGFIYPNIIIYTNYLFLGYYLFKYDFPQKYKKTLYIIAIISLIIMPIGDYFLTKDFRQDNLLVASSPFAFILATALFTFIKDNYNKLKLKSKQKKFLSYTSNIIFYIYMMHVIVMEIVKKLLFNFINPNRFIISNMFIIIEFILTFIISYIISILLNKIYNKTESIIKKKMSSK